MTGSRTTAIAARSGSTKTVGAKCGSRSSGFDFAHLVERADALGATNNEERAAKAGVSIRTFYRLQRNELGWLTILRIADIAKNLGTTSLRLQGVES